MNGIRPIFRLMALAYFRVALRQMGGDHPDAPYVVLRINALESK